MIRVVTLGAASSANKGAASMLQALIDRLAEVVGPCEVTVLSTFARADAAEPPTAPDGVAIRILDAAPVRLAGLQVPLALAARVAGDAPGGRRTGRTGRMGRLARRDPAIAAIADADLVVDLAGISFSDGRGVPTLIYNTLMTGLPLLVGTPTVKLAQALGPFREPLNRVVAPRVLRRLVAVCPRGEGSTANVERLGLTTVHPAADLAFLMDLPDAALAEATRVVSEARGVSGEGGTARSETEVVVMPSSVARRRAERLGIDYVARMADLCGALTAEGNDVLVVPHSSGGGRPGGRMDDREVCREVARLTPAGRGHVALLDRSLRPATLRAIIAGSDALVTSRFHAMISALATATPVLTVGWGHKYRETMAEFGMLEWCHDVGALVGDDLAGAALDLVDRGGAVRSTIAAALPAVRARSEVNLQVVAAALPAAGVATSSPTATGGQVTDSLAGVIDAGMCIGCGACTAADPEVRLEVDPVRLIMRPDRPSGADAAAVCPAVSVDFAGLHDRLFPDRPVTPYGVVERVWLAQSRDEDRNRKASSGGLIKELLLELLSRDDVDGAIALDHVHGLDFRPRLLTSADEVDELPGSIYHAVDLSAALDILRAEEGRFVLVAIPCQLEGIHQYISRIAPELADRIHTTIGLLCGWQYSHHSIDAMCDYEGLPADRIADVSYRGGGPVGRLRIELDDGRVATASRRVDLDYQVAFDRSFNASRCHVCINHSNFLADVVVGDAWLPATVFTKTGISLVVCRRPETDALLRDLEAKGRVSLKEASTGEIRSSQGDRVVFGNFAYAYADHLADIGVHRPEMTGPNRAEATLVAEPVVARFHREQERKARLRHARRYRALRRRKVTLELPSMASRYGKWFTGRILRRQDKVVEAPVSRTDLTGFR